MWIHSHKGKYVANFMTHVKHFESSRIGKQHPLGAFEYNHMPLMTNPVKYIHLLLHFCYLFIYCLK